ncbi:MAG: phosphate ABC transporter permease subunit PstC [Verrucomicrobiae bacterium]|nr:phosphate ABC transporter permease subunit PstC [Verrucomicrobiae bacterium]NNJ43893.1 phosphate ABC transporter permease subunit PstC [Akkermansiaceae bacterium]
MSLSQRSSQKNIPFGKPSGFRILGIGKQEAIKYFFGGNATLAVILIFLIVGFLAYHAWNFLPQYQKSLTLYRLSGQEFTDYASDQLTAQKELSSLASQIPAYELKHRLGALYDLEAVHSDFKNKAQKELIAERKQLQRAKSNLTKHQAKEPPIQADIDAAKRRVTESTANLKKRAVMVLDGIDYSDLENKSLVTDDAYLTDIRASVTANIISGKTSDFIQAIRQTEAEKTAAIQALPHMQQLAKARSMLLAPQKPFNNYLKKYRLIASDNKGQAETHSNAAERKKAQLTKAELATTDQQRKIDLIKAERILTESPDYDKLNHPLYSSLDEHLLVQKTLTQQTKEALAAMPTVSDFEGGKAQERIQKITILGEAFFPLIEAKRKKMESWTHKEPVTIGQALSGFFMGTQWVSNSSWQDFYGVLPLLAGSSLVALVAIAIAVPFAVGGAIYVNRLSSPFEQRWIKPIIEFIGAIPSIVMAFLGVVVVGALIQEHSQNPLVSWIPSFPVEQDKTILTAGILLALMSVPTVFTLAEDALNNVPKAYKEAALALGSTHLQTVLKVILPSCASGIIAAVLLGFGRIIGETMVVLLVMGGRIAIPSSVSDPAHSMTGIMAQEIGEVEQGSLHWSALFMVGLLLFVIALTLNYIAQTTLKRLSKHS